MEALKFKPILKTLVWGGEKIASFKGIDTDQGNIGESWELSAVPGNESIVSEGKFAGRTITSLAQEYKGRLIGNHVYAKTGDTFPLLLKFIDARRDLSVQVHPDDTLAARRHNGSLGKTEMWYVVDAAPGAAVISGLSKAITPQEYRERVASGTITEVLSRHEVHPGDVFYLPAGRIHAICGGCFIAEIQETSDITYRIFDYNRPGLDGKPRQLHTELAADAIDYKVYPDYRTRYSPAKDKECQLVSCPYFTTSLLDLGRPFDKDLSRLDSFYALMCIDGKGSIIFDGTQTPINRGETVLVPAEAKSVRLVPQSSIKLISCQA